MSDTKRGRKPLLKVTSTAKTEIDLPKARFVKINSEYPVTEGDVAIGIIGDEINSGEYVPITILGIEFIEIQEDVTAGTELTTGTDGKAKVKTTDDYCMGIALDDGINGDIIRIKLN